MAFLIESLTNKRSDKSTSMEEQPPNLQTNPKTNTEDKHEDLYTSDNYFNADDGADDAVYHVRPCYQKTVPKTQSQQEQKYQQQQLLRRQSSSSVVASTNACHQFMHLNPNHNPLPSSSSSSSPGGGLMVIPWRHCLILATLLLVLQATVPSCVAAPQSCILCDKNDLQAKDPQTNYEEFLFEHQVTRQDAIKALKQLNESFYDGLQGDSSCNAVRCTEKVSKYCLGPQFINDHCYCEFGHSTEGLPFVPHMCYVGEKAYKPTVGSCFFYEEVKECCCSALLAREWRHISSATSLYRSSSTIISNYHQQILLITCLYLLIRQLYF